MTENKSATFEMMNKEIAKHFFGLQEGVDYGEFEKHDWVKDEEGNIDELAYEDPDGGYHTGPVCQRCGTSYCSYCTPKYDEKKCSKSVPNYCEWHHPHKNLLNKLREDSYQVTFRYPVDRPDNVECSIIEVVDNKIARQEVSWAKTTELSLVITALMIKDIIKFSL